MEQRKTPLLDAIVDYTTNRPVYFKIPGHRYEKGISPRWRQWTGDGIFRFDLTEAEGLDDLHEPEGGIREAQELAAMVLASVKEGEKIMVARNAHKSVLMGLTLSGAVPVYLMPKQDPVTGLWGSLDPETVEEGFRQYPDCKAVFLVSPTYYGVCSNIRSIADICHRHGALLLVDEAHGGHLYFQKEGTATETLPRGAILQDADMCAQSMHKVTGSLTQSSLLHVGSDRVDLGRLEACLHMVQSTSPSYLLMTSLDAARYELALHGEEMLQRGLALAQMAREAMKKIPGITCVGEASRGKAIYDLDLVRLVISASDLGLSGYQLADRLYEKYKIGMELADDRYVLAVVTYANEESDMRQLVEALEDISRKMTGKNNVDVVNAETDCGRSSDSVSAGNTTGQSGRTGDGGNLGIYGRIQKKRTSLSRTIGCFTGQLLCVIIKPDLTKQEDRCLKLISWNVNGLRACVTKGFKERFQELDADIFCIQESKLQEGQIELELPGYYQYWNYAVKKGYSGTAIFTKQEPLSVRYGINIEEHDQEGRVITLEYPDFFMVTVYTPNSQNELARLPYRMQWEDDFLAYLKGLEKEKPVIFCGDLNVAHCERDLKNPKTNRKNAGFTDEERAKFSRVLESGFIDTFRYFYPEQEGIYSWWSYRFKAREKNAGWRIDYFCVSESLKDRLEDAKIHTEIFGSDHCPVELDICL